MKMKNKIIQILFILIILTSSFFSQTIINSSNSSLNLQPEPKVVVQLNKTIIAQNSKIFLPVVAEKNEEKKAGNYFNYLLGKQLGPGIYSKIANTKEIIPGEWKIKIELVPLNKHLKNDQYYSIKCSESKKEIKISSPGQLGLLYGCVTFIKFIEVDKGEIKINLFNIVDWPSYSRRIISAALNKDNAEEVLNFTLLNKIETVAIASRIYSWYKTDPGFTSLLNKIKEWKDRFGGPKIMQMHNIYEGRKIEISNHEDVDSLFKVIEAGINHGVEKLMILADDTPPFQYGEGYILTSDNDKKMFKHMAEAHSYLLKEIENRLKEKSYSSELYYVPPFYTYEDMNYGDMNLYKNTPWEKDAYDPFTTYLNFVGQNMPADVFIIWSGPNVRSRKITFDDLKDWTKNLKGRVPFLWDNTLYSHYPFTTSSLFTSYENDFPKDFYKGTGGNGMFINDVNGTIESKTAIVTVADYLWNPGNYDPQKSLNIAMTNYYGKETIPLLVEFKNLELDLRKKIGERKLWFEADSLWTVIRKIRFITEKNPVYYQHNYNSLKAFRMQAKYSVGTPLPKQKFIEECFSLDKKRTDIIAKINLLDKSTAEMLKKMSVPLPDFNKEQ
jgi:hypothetical protein